jgi:hypothetical protein
MRVQLIIALVAGLVLVAVPLYLWRRPGASKHDSVDGGADAAVVEAGPLPDATTNLLAAALDGGSVSSGDIALEKVKMVKCQRPGPGKTTPDMCDRQPFFEEALVKAVLENVSCAPKVPKGGSVSFAMKIDFKKKSFHVWAGRSGTIRAKRAAPVIECISRAIPTPNWEALAHQYTVYTIAVQATYPPNEKASEKGSKDK